MDDELTLGELIEFLERLHPGAEASPAFGSPHSYRGYYEDLAFEPVGDGTAGEMLAHAKSALNETFTGYKGGNYCMGHGTRCWVAPWGDTVDDPLDRKTLRRWFGLMGECRQHIPELQYAKLGRTDSKRAQVTARCSTCGMPMSAYLCASEFGAAE